MKNTENSYTNPKLNAVQPAFKKMHLLLKLLYINDECTHFLRYIITIFSES